MGRAISGNRWRVPVGPELLPQLIEVLFVGHLPRDPGRGGETLFAAPAITGIPVTQTLWTVQGPPNSPGGRPTLIHTRSDARRLDDKRRATSESLRKRGLADTSQVHPSDRDAWRADWDARVRQFDQRIESPGSRSDDRLPVDLSSQWLADSAHAGPQVHCELRGAASHLDVQYAHDTWRVILVRAAHLTMLLAIIGSSMWLANRAWARELWMRCPQLLIASAGLVWWLFFVPSALGLLVMVLGAVSALRPRWKTQAAEY
jgi:hypothetical protein